MRLSLIRHPDSVAAAVDAIDVEVVRKHASLTLTFELQGDTAALLLPEAAPPGRVDGLWRHTCFEAFVRLAAGDPTGPVRSPEPVEGRFAHAILRQAEDGDSSEQAHPFTHAAYCEFNFAPSTHWAAYTFDGYRSGMVEASLSAPIVTCDLDHARLVLTASLALTNLDADREWDIGLSAVIEARDGRKSYWALAHPPGVPDFHHPDCFAARIAPSHAA